MVVGNVENPISSCENLAPCKAAAEILTMSCLLLNKGSRRIVFLTLLQPSDKLIGLGSSSFLSPSTVKPYVSPIPKPNRKLIVPLYSDSIA